MNRGKSKYEIIFDGKVMQAVFVMHETSTVDEIVIEYVVMGSSALEGYFLMNNFGMYIRNLHRKPIHC